MGRAAEDLEADEHERKARKLREKISDTEIAQKINRVMSISRRQKEMTAEIERNQNAREMDAEAHEDEAKRLREKRRGAAARDLGAK